VNGFKSKGVIEMAFYDGDSIYITKGKFNGVRGIVIRWSASANQYIVEIIDPNDKRLKEIVLKEDEMETVFQHDKRLGLI
jgi:ribosomal protein L24